MQGAKVARFGDNMRDVAVTEGDKVAAQIQLGFSVYGYGVGELVRAVQDVPGTSVDKLVAEYDEQYVMHESLRAGGKQRAALCEAARIELGMAAFLEQGQLQGFHHDF